ncbi:MAG TPA: hypothetical protein VH186_16640 [Chloroflexia bacterium]|nr:hypothetical protein [Chloroflexia bacterium]
MEHEVIQWVTAAPLWDSLNKENRQVQHQRMQQPALLCFERDDFIEYLGQRLQASEVDLSDLVAQPRSYRPAPVGATASWNPKPKNNQLKLYQPVHGNFYLVAANLVCRQVGLPDRRINPAQNEAAGFVIRRLDLESGQEMAWVSSSNKQLQGWYLLDSAEYEQRKNLEENGVVTASEEMLPLSPLNYRQNGQKRRLLVGLIPTSSRDTFQTARQVAPLASPGDDKDPATNKVRDPRLNELDNRILATLASLIPINLPSPLPDPLPDDVKTALARSRQQKETSLFLMLDLADFIQKYLPGLWDALKNSTTPINLNYRELYLNLISKKAPYIVIDGSGAAHSWQEALLKAWDEWDIINGENKATGEVADNSANPPQPSLIYDLGLSGFGGDSSSAAANRAALRQQFQTALGEYQPPQDQPGASMQPVDLPKLDPRPEVRYILRCVFHRPNCHSSSPDIFSQPSDPFVLAPFFDFDAPARPVRITLPVDTSVTGLRKFNKNVAFLISDQLREQMGRVTDLNKALKGDLASGEEFNLGEICNFSIPIITICALLVLMIFINLLNIVFWWLPLLRVCLPLGLLSKLKNLVGG